MSSIIFYNRNKHEKFASLKRGRCMKNYLQYACVLLVITISHPLQGSEFDQLQNAILRNDLLKINSLLSNKESHLGRDEKQALLAIAVEEGSADAVKIFIRNDVEPELYALEMGLQNDDQAKLAALISHPSFFNFNNDVIVQAFQQGTESSKIKPSNAKYLLNHKNIELYDLDQLYKNAKNNPYLPKGITNIIRQQLESRVGSILSSPDVNIRLKQSIRNNFPEFIDAAYHYYIYPEYEYNQKELLKADLQSLGVKAPQQYAQQRKHVVKPVKPEPTPQEPAKISETQQPTLESGKLINRSSPQCRSIDAFEGKNVRAQEIFAV